MEVFGNSTCAGYLDPRSGNKIVLFTTDGQKSYPFDSPENNMCLLDGGRLVSPGIGCLSVLPDDEKIPFLQVARSRLLTCDNVRNGFYGIFQSNEGGLTLSKLRLDFSEKPPKVDTLGKVSVTYGTTFSVARGFALVDGKLYRESPGDGDSVNFELCSDFNGTSVKAALGAVTYTNNNKEKVRGTALFEFHEDEHEVTIKALDFERENQVVKGVVAMYDGLSVVLNLGNGNLWHDWHVHKTGMNVAGATACGDILYFYDNTSQNLLVWKVGQRKRRIGFSFDGDTAFFFDATRGQYILNNMVVYHCADHGFMCCGHVVTMDKEEWQVHHEFGGTIAHVKNCLLQGCEFIRDVHANDQFFVCFRPDGNRDDMEVYLAKMDPKNNYQMKFAPYLAHLRSFDAGHRYSAALSCYKGKMQVTVRRRDGGDSVPCFQKDVEQADRVYCDDAYVYLYTQQTASVTAICIETQEEATIEKVRGVWSEESVIIQLKNRDLVVNWPRKNHIFLALGRRVLAAALAKQKLCLWRDGPIQAAEIIDLSTWSMGPNRFMEEQMLGKLRSCLGSFSTSLFNEFTARIGTLIESVTELEMTTLASVEESAAKILTHFPHMTTVKEMNEHVRDNIITKCPSEYMNAMLAMPCRTLNVFLDDERIEELRQHMSAFSDEHKILLASKIAEFFHLNPSLFLPIMMDCLLAVDITNRNAARVRRIANRMTGLLQQFVADPPNSSNNDDTLTSVRTVLHIIHSLA